MAARIAPEDKYNCDDTDTPDPAPSCWLRNARKVQRICLQLVIHKRFDHVVLALIGLNSVCLACDDPTGLYPDRQKVVNQAEMIFQLLFTIELLLKVLAYGCDAKTGYLTEGWNRLDAFIVTMGYIEWVVGDAAGGLSALRCVRALRPLRTINRLPQLKVIISTLLSSLPQLFHVVQLCGFVYSLFALIGLQIWSGDKLHMNCYSLTTGSIYLDDGGQQICNPGTDAVYSCDEGYSCVYYRPTPQSSTISFDNFGNALTVAFWVASLESWTNVVTYLEDSQEWGELWIMMCWCISVVLIGGGLCMNLAPAVLKACFSDIAEAQKEIPAAAPAAVTPGEQELTLTTEDEFERMAEEMVASSCVSVDDPHRPSPVHIPEHENDMGNELERMAEELMASPVEERERTTELDPRDMRGLSMTELEDMMADGELANSAAAPPRGSGTGTEAGCEGLGVDITASTEDKLWSNEGTVDLKVDKLIAELDLDIQGGDRWGSKALTRRRNSITNAESVPTEDEVKADEKPDEEDTVMPPCCSWWISVQCHRLATDTLFSSIFFILICCNTIILVIDSNDLDDTGDLIMKMFNYFFTAIFTVELLIKLFAFGKNFFYDSLNIFDFFIVLVSILEVALSGGGASSTSILRMLRMLRLARLLKVVRMSRSIGATKVVLSVLFAMLPTLQYIGMLCFLTAFVYAILGMGLFGGKMSFPGTGVPDSNFDDFGSAFLSTFQLITLEDWPVVFESTKNATSFASFFYILMVVVIGNFVLLNLMLAIMLAFFEEPDMAAQITRRGVLVEGGGVATNLGMEPVDSEPEPETEKSSEGEVELEVIEVDIGQCCELRREEGTMRCLQIYSQQAISVKEFSYTIEIMIVINCIIMAVDPNQEVLVLSVIDNCFTVVFVVEVVLKVIAFTPKVYWNDPGNKLDFTVVAISVISIMLTSVDLGFLKALRAARVIRPLRLVTRSEGMMLVASSLLQSIPGMLNVGLVCFMGWLVFGILGMEFFKALEGGYCSDASMATEEMCEGMFANEYATLVYRRWVTTDAKFTNTLITWLTLFQIASLEGWVDIMYHYTNHPDGTYFGSFFFMAWVMLSNWLLVNLWVGVIWINFVNISEERQGWGFLTDVQRQWVVSQRRAVLLEPTKSMLRPYQVNYVRRICYDIATHSVYQRSIDVCIVLNIVTIALTHHGQSTEWDTAIVCLNTFFSINYFAEACLKILGFRWEGYWRDGWNRFEFVLAMYVFGDIAVFIVTLLPDVSMPDSGIAKLGLRLVVFTRCLRIVRLMRRLEGVSTMLYTLARALPAVCNIGLLLLLLLYMYAVAGIILFQDVVPHGGITHIHNFKHFGYSAWTIFLICTGDIWPDMMYNCMYTGPECSDSLGNCGNPLAAVYFVTLIILVTFLLLNMFVTILVDQFIEARRIFLGRITIHDLDKFRSMWAFYDREGLGYIAPHHLQRLLIELPEPLGLDNWRTEEEKGDKDHNYMRGVALRAISEMHLDDHDGKAHFAQVIWTLSERANQQDAAGARMDLLYQLLEQEREKAIPAPKMLQVEGFEGTIDERLAASVVIHYIWRKKHIENLKKGRIPPNISSDFKESVQNSEEETKKAAATLLRVCYIIWSGFDDEQLEEGKPVVATTTNLSFGADNAQTQIVVPVN